MGKEKTHQTPSSQSTGFFGRSEAIIPQLVKIAKLHESSQDRAQKEIVVSVERKNSYYSHFHASVAFHKHEGPLFFDINQNKFYDKPCCY